MAEQLDSERILRELEDLIETHQQTHTEEFPSEAHFIDLITIEDITSFDVRYGNRENGERLIAHDSVIGETEGISLAYICSCGETFHAEDAAIDHLRTGLTNELINRLREHDATTKETAVPYDEISHDRLSHSREIIRQLIDEDDNPITPVDDSYKADLYLNTNQSH